MYRESPISLNFCILSLLFVNDPQALYINPDLSSEEGCLKYTSGINLSSANKNLLAISLILYLVLTY